MYLDLVKRHPVATAIGTVVAFLFWTLPQWLATLWPAFVRDKTIPEWLADKTWPGIPPQVYAVLSVGVFVLLVALAIIGAVSNRGSGGLPSAEDNPKIAQGNIQQTLREFRAHEAALAYKQSIISVQLRQAEQGLHFAVTNNERNVIDDFRLFVKDLRFWSEARDTFVEVKEFHREGQFAEVELPLAERRLFHGEMVTAPFLHVEPECLWVMGPVRSATHKEYIRREGVWQVTVRHELGGETVVHNQVWCFTWKKGSLPKQCDCPDDPDLIPIKG